MPPFVLSAEARQWIVNRTLAGAGAEELIAELIAAGWQRKTAIEALKLALSYSAKTGAGAKPQPAMPLSDKPVPEPNLLNSPLFVDAGDRQVRVLAAMRKPRLVVFGDLLDAAECADLIEQAGDRIKRSETLDRKTGGVQIDPARTSRGMFFQRGESELIARVEQRIAKLLNWPAENGEGLQILHYEPGAEYVPHYDYFDLDDAGTPAVLKHGGHRVASLIIYLNTPERGGATIFPDVGVDVMPQQGNAVFFSYARPDPSTQTLHGGAPVLAGEKWIATKWLRERVFA
ncbi:MAG TPA: 2OG-Fe(II) oxygenase [Rudaea sp.]|jgi:prolyl 4-hydroxylase|uniref:2OG-Fe(II) oxygenase n=1 Tax=Rudaea sp. TaxID=2136325 RepID=UPI002F952439